jgi:hypothetical protein
MGVGVLLFWIFASLRRLATTGKRLWRFLSRRWGREKLCDRNAQRVSQFVQEIDRGVFALSLQAADIGTVYASVIRKALLRHVAINSQAPEIPS